MQTHGFPPPAFHHVLSTISYPFVQRVFLPYLSLTPSFVSSWLSPSLPPAHHHSQTQRHLYWQSPLLVFPSLPSASVLSHLLIILPFIFPCLRPHRFVHTFHPCLIPPFHTGSLFYFFPSQYKAMHLFMLLPSCITVRSLALSLTSYSYPTHLPFSSSWPRPTYWPTAEKPDDQMSLLLLFLLLFPTSSLFIFFFLFFPLLSFINLSFLSSLLLYSLLLSLKIRSTFTLLQKGVKSAWGLTCQVKHMERLTT